MSATSSPTWTKRSRTRRVQLGPCHNLAKMADVRARVEELAGMLDEHNLTAIKIKDGDLSIELRRDVAAISSQGSQERGAGNMEGEVVPSPMVGVFYSRPSPAEDPFVQPGDRISVGQVIGIIEAMKVFNEVESPISGIVQRCLVEDGAVVQEGDPLYVLEV